MVSDLTARRRVAARRSQPPSLHRFGDDEPKSRLSIITKLPLCARKDNLIRTILAYPRILAPVLLITIPVSVWLYRNETNIHSWRRASAHHHGEREVGADSDRRAPYSVQDLSHIFAKRPNWRTDYTIDDWIPKWLPREHVADWEASRSDATLEKQLYGEDRTELPTSSDDGRLREEKFWEHASVNFTVALASNGLGHRLAQLSYAYLCSVVPDKRQLLLHWVYPQFKDNRVWHNVFDDSAVIAGVPAHWKPAGDESTIFERANLRRQAIGKGRVAEGKLVTGPDHQNGDYNHYFDMNSGRRMCAGFAQPRDLWMLRFAKEPSVQEFYMLLRAQLKQRLKDRLADFIDTNFPKDKLVIGVHVRSGNGKDDGQGHFNLVQRGDWLKDMPAAVTMVRKHVRMVAYSIIDRFNSNGHQGMDFDKDEYEKHVDNSYCIFLATDSPAVLEEFRRQDPTVLSLPQERSPDGEGVPINSAMKCLNRSKIDCAIHAEASMLLDAMIMSSCDAALAESYSNFMYTLPAALSLAEGRIFCESGRAALGGKYTFKDESSRFLGDTKWWEHPPANVMPVRCHQGGWAARDRSNLNIVEDVP